MNAVVSVLFFLLGLIHVAPLVGVVSSAKVSSLYGIAVSEPNLAVLMRHRAVLFGVLGVSLLVAAFVRAWQAPTLAAVGVSMVSFALLALDAGALNSAMKKVLLVDIVGIGLAVLAAALLALR